MEKQQQKQKTAKSRNQSSQRYKTAGKQNVNKIRRIARQVLKARKKVRLRNCAPDTTAELNLRDIIGAKELAKFNERGMAAFK